MFGLVRDLGEFGSRFLMRCLTLVAPFAAEVDDFQAQPNGSGHRMDQTGVWRTRQLRCQG